MINHKKNFPLLEFPMQGEYLPPRNSQHLIFPLHWLKLWVLSEPKIQL